MLIFIFLSSGLFLGWSLGANDASNIFGTAVGTKMLKFRTAAIVASIFVVLGAVISGTGTSHTLGKLGAVNEISGAFMVALSAGFTVFWMTKLKLPVSTSQAVVGSIIGWNWFSGTLTDYNALIKILLSWITSPMLAAVFAIIIYFIVRKFTMVFKVSLFRLDTYTRIGLILIGSFGAYSLGANNIANVMGVFVPISPFKTFSFAGIDISGLEQLFLIGGLSIAVGIMTYSKKVMETVGTGLVKMSPQAALVVVASMSLVLFLFASNSLHTFLVSHHLPAFPLVPVSSSQLVIGAVVGIGIAHGGKNIKYSVLGRIASGWISTPIISAIITFVALFFLQNVFDQNVYKNVSYKFSAIAIEKLEEQEIIIPPKKIKKYYKNAISLKRDLLRKKIASKSSIRTILNYTQYDNLRIDHLDTFNRQSSNYLSEDEISAINLLKNQEFAYRWQFKEAMAELNGFWKIPENNINSLTEYEAKVDYICDYFTQNKYVKIK